jgi:hypothetical protein
MPPTLIKVPATNAALSLEPLKPLRFNFLCLRIMPVRLIQNRCELPVVKPKISSRATIAFIRPRRKRIRHTAFTRLSGLHELIPQVQLV